MTPIRLLIPILIAWGSLYPFDFRWQPADWDALFAGLRHAGARGDILANIVLFVPLGIVGGWSSTRPWRLWGEAAALAVTLQVIQLWLPSRDANLQDVVWNLLGTGVGLVLAARLPRPGPGARSFPAASFPGLLLACWIAARLSPFVPTLDLKTIKQSIKPALLPPDPGNLLLHTAAWATFAALFAAVTGRRRDPRLPLFVVALFALEILIQDNALSSAAILGAATGLGLWYLLPARAGGGAAVLTLALALGIAADGLTPLELRPAPVPVNWLPFHGFLGGNMLLNINSLLTKGFLYGSLLWAGTREGASLRFVAGFAVLLTAAIELGQTRLVGHTPELTDPLLVLLLAWALARSGTAWSGTGAAGPSAAAGHRPGTRLTGSPPCSSDAPESGGE